MGYPIVATLAFSTACTGVIVSQSLCFCHQREMVSMTSLCPLWIVFLNYCSQHFVCFAGSACIWARGRSDPLLVFSHLRRSPKRLARGWWWNGRSRSQHLWWPRLLKVPKKKTLCSRVESHQRNSFIQDRFTHIDYGMLSVCNFEVLPRAF